MTPEQQRIAIAEVCGWKPGGSGKTWGDGQTYGIPPKGEEWHWQQTPDYLNDLNAMHEAEKILTDDQYHMQFLPYLGASAIHDSVCISRRCTSATASQRAESFLRALNLWTT